MAEKQVKDYEKFVVRFPDGMRDELPRVSWRVFYL
ncbi:regulatory protein [Escherichia coli]|nr:regulatory protein [Escherichia coli]